MKTPDLKRNFILNTLYQIVLIVVPFLTAPYVSRVLGVTNNGIYSYTTSIQLYFSLLAALGTASYGMREIARNREDEEKRSELFFEIELLSVISSTIMMIIWFIFILFQTQYQVLYWILTLNLFNTMLDISWFYSGMEQFSYTVTRNSFFKILGVIFIFLLVKTENDLVMYTIIMSLSTLLGTASMWLSLPKFIKKVPIQFEHLKRHLQQTFIYFVPTIATSVYTVLDKTLIGVITQDPMENGYYEQATKAISMVKALTYAAINGVLGSRISYLFAQQKYDEIKQRILFSIDYIMFMGIGCAFGLIAVAPQLVPWFFGEEYAPAIPLVQLMAPIVIIIGVSNCLDSQYYSPAGKRKESSYYIIVGAIVNFVLNIILIQRLKSQGAVIASLTAEFVITFLFMKYCNNYLSWKDLWSKCYKRFIAAIVMLVVIMQIPRFISSYFICLMIQIVIGVLIYVFMLYIMNDQFEKKLLNQTFGKLINVVKKS